MERICALFKCDDDGDLQMSAQKLISSMIDAIDGGGVDGLEAKYMPRKNMTRITIEIRGDILNEPFLYTKEKAKGENG